MRLAGQKKMGYYPTPLSVVSIIRDRVVFPEKPFAVFDPCCGKGEALEVFCRDTSAVTYGVEADGERAEMAKGALAHVMRSPIEDCRIAHKSFSVIWLNPPYDWNAKDADAEPGVKSERKEISFLKRSIPWLCDDGLLVYIIPDSVFTSKLQEILAQHFEDLSIFTFPPDEYEAFGQIIVMGRKVNGRRKHHETDARNDEKGKNTSFTVPGTNPSVKLFQSRFVTADQMAGLLRGSPVRGNFFAWTCGRQAARHERRPPLPLHSGHLSLSLASGELDGVIGEGSESHVIKGCVKKVPKVTHETQIKDEATVAVTKSLDQYKVSIKLLTRTGEIRELT
jgi:tRNA1(Val) A37 N6-methylase TrmN6